MRLVKLFLITVALVGIVLSCGCMGSNSAGQGEGVKTISEEGVIKTQGVKKSTFSKTVKIKCGNEEFEVDKEGYNAIVNNEIPDWAIEKIQRDTGLPREKVVENCKKSGAVVMIIPTMLCWDGVEGLIYDSGEFKKDGIALGLIDIPLSKDAFFEFCYLNGANDVYLNESKYQKQYKDFLKVGADAEKWFNATVRGKLVVIAPSVGTYVKDVDDSLDIYMLKQGWAFIPKGQIPYNGTTPVNPYEDEKDKRPYDYKYWQKRIEAEKYAQEHRLGIWAIEFPKNENQ